MLACFVQLDVMVHQLYTGIEYGELIIHLFVF